MDWTLRLAGPEDHALVLGADVFDTAADPQATARFLGRVGQPDPRNILVLAELDGRVVGFASGTVLDHPDKSRNLFVQELGVNDDMQRRGIARALMAFLRDEGRQRGCMQTWVLTEAGNAAARATYLATSGQETPDIVMYTWDEALPAGPEG